MPTDTRAEADIRLDRILDFVEKGPNGTLRTHLDEWAAFEFGGELLTRTGRQRWFNNPCPIRQGPTLLKHMDWFHFEAAEILRRGARGDPAVRKPKSGEPAPFRIIVEHAVPVRVIRELLKEDLRIRTRSSLREFLQHHFRRAVLAKKHDEVLRSTPSGRGASLVSEMPSGWKAWGDPFARYFHAGLA